MQTIQAWRVAFTSIWHLLSSTKFFLSYSLAHPRLDKYIHAGSYRYHTISNRHSVVIYTSKRPNIWKEFTILNIFIYFYFLPAIRQLTQPQETILRFLRYLLPIISSSHSSSTSESSNVMKKVKSDLDYFLPFRQHAPSLANARHEIYADIDRLTSPTGIGLFNILAFRGVFFGSPFASV